MAQPPLETAAVSVLVLMVASCVVGFVLISTDILAPYPWTLTFAAIGIIAAVGGLVYGIARAAQA